MRMIEEGLALIRRFEGFSARSYRCPAGVWTVGFGHTSAAGPPAVSAGMTMTRGEANEILRRDSALFAGEVARSLQHELSDRQFSALVSFAFNVGIGNFRKSSVLAAVNGGDLAAVPRRLQLWVKANGRTLPGLVRRRAAEAEMFIGGSSRADGRSSAGPISASDGKPVHRSTTVAAAIAAMLSGIAGTLSSGGLLTAIILILIIIVSAAWIIRERRRKAKEEGV